MLAGLSSCGRYVLHPEGFRQVKLGASYEVVEVMKWRGDRRDTVFSEGDYSWRGTVLGAGDGQILVEEDFFGDQRINRIRVESEKFRTREGLRVGDELSALKALASSWYVTPLPEYGLTDLFSDTYPAYHFLVEWLPDDRMTDSLSIDMLSDTLPISGIVLM